MATTKLGKILDKVVPVDSDHHRSQKKLLWTNASPTSTFGAQTISLSLTDYDEVEIIFNLTEANQSKYKHRTEIGKQGVGFACYGGNNYLFGVYRVYNPSTTGVYFNTGYQAGHLSDIISNNSCMPYQIYGIINK